MSLNYYVKLREPHQDSIVTISLRLFAAMMFLVLFGASSAFGQATYSESWFDDSDPNAGYVDGCGETEGDYYMQYDVYTHLTSPNGRIAWSVDNGYQAGYSRADVSMSWDWDDAGDYDVSSEHWELCPEGGEIDPFIIGTTSVRVRLGISATRLYYDGSDGSRYYYHKVVNCYVRCPTDIYISSDFKGEFILSYVAWGPLGCFSVNLVVANAPPGPCYEVAGR